MYLGIDLGTSELKVVVLADNHRVVASASEPITSSRPRPLWSEQDPASWWSALDAAMLRLLELHPVALAGVRAIAPAGQMHGAVLLDAADAVLRPAILWNDGRSARQCEAPEAAMPALRSVAGNAAMPGFTAPKLLWVREHEPSVFARTARVLLPKDWLRLGLTGDHVSEMSDASGTLWLDVGGRAWSDELIAACHLTREHSLAEARLAVPALSLIGSGARSDLWAQMLASLLAVAMRSHDQASACGAVVAARLAWLADGGNEREVCKALAIRKEFLPNPVEASLLLPRHERFRALYPALRGQFGAHRAMVEASAPAVHG
jgi:sugar (pentulose or hexulose) kinase